MGALQSAAVGVQRKRGHHPPHNPVYEQDQVTLSLASLPEHSNNLQPHRVMGGATSKHQDSSA